MSTVLADAITRLAARPSGAGMRRGTAVDAGSVDLGGGAVVEVAAWVFPPAPGQPVLLLSTPDGSVVGVPLGGRRGRLTVTGDDGVGETISVKAGPAADNAFIGFYPDSQSQGTRWAWIGFGAAGSNELRITNDKGPLILPGEVQIGAGAAYPGATAGGGTSNRVGFRWASPNIVGVVDNAVSAVVGTVSTGRLKTGIRAVAGAVDTVLRLRPVTYTPLELDGTQRADAGEHIGLIAEEVAEAVPSAVLHDAVGKPASVNYMELTPLLIAAVQELAARVAALEGSL